MKVFKPVYPSPEGIYKSLLLPGFLELVRKKLRGEGNVIKSPSPQDIDLYRSFEEHICVLFEDFKYAAFTYFCS